MIDTKIYFLVSVLFSKRNNKLNYYQVRHNGKNYGYEHVSLIIKGEGFNPNTLFMKCDNNTNTNNNNNNSYMEMDIFTVETCALWGMSMHVRVFSRTGGSPEL